MPSTYTLNNGIELIATGEQSGTWGDTTNTNMSLLDTALDGQVTVTLASAGTSGSPNTLPISDGAASDGRNRLVIFNDGADLGATAYVQLTPNDAEKIVYIRNALSGSRSIIVFQGTYNASNDYEIPAGTTAVVYFNGGGTGAVAANVFNNAYFDGLRLGSVSVTAILDEDNMASDSATALATQQSIKAYVDSQVGTVDTWAEVLANGNTTGATDAVVSAGQKLTTNTIDETTAASGVTIDSVLLKDGDVTGTIGATSASAGTFTTFTSTGIDDNATSTKFTVADTGISVTGDIDITDTSPAVVFNDNSVTNLTHKINSSSDNLRLTADENNVDSGSRIEFFVTTSLDTLRLKRDEAVFNEGGADIDFRVESDAASHMLFVDAGNNRVGIGEAAPDNPLHVTTSSAGDILTLESTNAGVGVGPSINLFRNSSSPADNDLGPAFYFRGENSVGGQHTYASIYSQFNDVTDGAEDTSVFHQISIAGTARSVLSLKNAEVVINDESQNVDFRVESDSNTHMLFVNAGLDQVAIGSGTISAPSGYHLFSYGSGSGARSAFVHGAGDGGIVVSGAAGGSAASVIFGNNWGTNGATFSEEYRIFMDGADDSLKFNYNANASTAMELASNGFVSIGGDTPLTPLHVKYSNSGELLRLESTDAGVGDGPTIGLFRNSASPADGDGLGSINFYGEDSSSNITTYASIRTEASDVSNGTEDGLMSIRTIVGGSDTARLNFKSSEAVFNEAGADLDFRIESSSTANQFFLDGGTGLIGINDGTPSNHLDINGSLSFDRVASRNVSTGAVTNNFFVIYDLDFSANGFSTNQHIIRIIAAGSTSGQMASADLLVTFKQQSGSRFFNIVPIQNDNLTLGYIWDASGGGTSNGNLKIYAQGPAAYSYIQVYATNRDGNPSENIIAGTFPMTDTGSASAPAGMTTLESPLNYSGNKYNQSGRVDNTFVINEAGHDINFRVETDTNTHGLFLDAGAESVSVMTANTAASLNVGGDSNGALDVLQLRNDDSTYSQSYTWNLDTGKNLVVTGASGSGGYKWNGGTNGFVINEDSNNMDFRVESDNISSMLMVDAGEDELYVGGVVDLGASVMTVKADTGDFNSFAVGPGSNNSVTLGNFTNGDEIANLITSSSKFGSVIQGGANGSLVLGIRDNDVTDGVFIISGTGTGGGQMTNGYSRLKFAVTPNGVVVNETGDDSDFRVESDTNTHALFVDAGNSRVGINESLPGAHLHILGNNDSDGATLKLQEANNNTSDTLGTIFFGNNADDTLSHILGYTNTNNTTSYVRINSTSTGTVVKNVDFGPTEVKFNDNGANVDFRVESDSNANAIFLNADTERLGLFTSTTDAATNYSNQLCGNVALGTYSESVSTIATSSSVNIDIPYSRLSRGVYELAFFGFQDGGATQAGCVVHVYVMTNPNDRSINTISNRSVTVAASNSGSNLRITLTNTSSTFSIDSGRYVIRRMC